MARKSFRGALGVLSVVDPYGTKGQEPEGEVLITPGLEACRPDPEQPRQVLPPDLRDRLLGGASPAEVLDAAWERCLGEDLYAAMKSHALSPAEALERRREAGVLDLALQLTLEGLVELADSIARHGLRQPINVYDLGDGKYRIAEGERRWWAHVHLAHIVGRAEFGVIPAADASAAGGRPGGAGPAARRERTPSGPLGGGPRPGDCEGDAGSNAGFFGNPGFPKNTSDPRQRGFFGNPRFPKKAWAAQGYGIRA